MLNPEIDNMLKERLKRNWMIILGPPNLVCYIEDTVYTPGTEKNGDFEAILSPGSRCGAFFLVRKNCDLKSFLGNPPDFDDMLVLEVLGAEGRKLLTSVSLRRPMGDRGVCIERIVERLMTPMRNGE